MLERIGLVLVTPGSATVIRTEYELHSFAVSLYWCRPIKLKKGRNCRV